MNAIQARYGYAQTVDLATLNPTLECLLQHSSCRAFSDQAIPQSMRDTLYAAAQSAPSKSNLQQYSFLEVTEEHIRTQLMNWFPALAWAFGAPMLTFSLGDLHRNQVISAHHGYEYNAHPEDAFLNAAVDAALATQALITAAESQGFGTCPISQIRERLHEVADLLALPNGVFPICAVAIGLPASGAPSQVSPRLPADLVIHHNRYQPPSLEAITSYDARFNEAKGLPKVRYPERFGEPNKPTWSDNVARQTAVEERAQLRDYLRLKGILG